MLRNTTLRNPYSCPYSTTRSPLDLASLDALTRMFDGRKLDCELNQFPHIVFRDITTAVNGNQREYQATEVDRLWDELDRMRLQAPSSPSSTSPQGLSSVASLSLPFCTGADPL